MGTANVFPQQERSLGSVIRGLIASMRIYQWSKNLLIFSGVIFSGRLSDLGAVEASVAAFASFCLVSSAVYLLNDARDIESDRHHPKKRLRPIAAGIVSPAIAYIAIAVLLAAGGALASRLPLSFIAVLVFYVLLNVGYSCGLKNVVILDVMLVAFGFVLRAVAGALVIGVQASDWLILCTLSLALLISVGKRRQEIGMLVEKLGHHRATLDEYSLPYLDVLMAILASLTIMKYSLYAVSEHTTALFGSNRLIWTVPMVVYGVARYLYLSFRHGEGGDPAKLLLTDRPTFVNAVLWAITVCLVIYLRF